MKVAKIRPKGERSWCIAEIDELNFGLLAKELQLMEVGQKIDKRLNPEIKEGDWGNFGNDFNGNHKLIMTIKIDEMSERELASLPEFDGW